MKKLLYLFLLPFIFSCDRELEYGSNFNFEAINLTNTPIYQNSLKSFSLELTNVLNIDSNKTYSFSYSLLEGQAMIKQNSVILIEEQFYSFQADSYNLINFDIIPESLGAIKFEIILKDNNNVIVTKQFLVNSEVLATPFELLKIDDFSVKNTLESTFKFALNNINPTNTYQIKFMTTNPAKIYKNSGEEIIRNIWNDLTLIPGSIYTYKYNALSDIDDVLELQIKDNYGQIKSITYNVHVFAKPQLTVYSIDFKREPPILNFPMWRGVWKTSTNLIPILSNNATITKTKISIKNKITGNIELIEFNNAFSNNILESGIINEYGGSSAQVLSIALNQSKYAGQLYLIQILDSDGVWSDIYQGTVITI